MKIKVVSDLHIEMSDIDIFNDNDYDVLILSGDICVLHDLKVSPVSVAWNDAEEPLSKRAKRGLRFADFFQRCSTRFPHVVYVMGNHEHYNGKFDQSADIFRKMLDDLQLHNIYLLDNDTKQIDDVYFVGGTLWTDMNGGDKFTMYHLEHCMNDFSVIRIAKENFRKFLPVRAMAEFHKTKSYISHVIENLPEDAKVVVVTHHTPSFQSAHPKYAADTLMNGGYHSNLDQFILDRPKIKLWTHGHTHETFDYFIGTTRIVCNPRGYETYSFVESTGWNPNITVEI